MSINLKNELVKLLRDEGLGRIAYLRKTSGRSAVNTGGGYNPKDPLVSEGHLYRDYEVLIYRSHLFSEEIKAPGGKTDLTTEVIYLAATSDIPQPTQEDKIIEIKYDVDGTISEPRLISNIINIDSVLEHWSDVLPGNMTYYTISPARLSRK